MKYYGYESLFSVFPANRQSNMFREAVVLMFFILLYKVYCCRDENNEQVDWFAVYKLPIYKKHSNVLISKGLAYAYISSENPSSGWKLSDISVNDTKSILGQTLFPLYDNVTDLKIFYNDQPPPDSHVPENNKLGHTKGVIYSNNSQGYWLIHSIPHFPPVNSYSYPSKALIYGQNILCISMNLTNLDFVGIQMQYNQPNIYKSVFNSNLSKILPNIFHLINKEFVKNPPWYNLKEIYSLTGEKFLSFAKSRQFKKELYADWVAPELRTNLNVESWLHGPGRIKSDCSKIYNVKNIEALNITQAKMNFNSERDHSKWAVSTENSNKWICIGDINRAEHQKYRGGGTICINNYLKLWQHYYEMITQIESCN